MENQVFQKVQTQEEYRNMIGKIVMHMHSKCKFLGIIESILKQEYIFQIKKIKSSNQKQWIL